MLSIARNSLQRLQMSKNQWNGINMIQENSHEDKKQAYKDQKQKFNYFSLLFLFSLVHTYGFNCNLFFQVLSYILKDLNFCIATL